MRWKNFDFRFRSGSATTAKVSDIPNKTAGQNKNVSSAVRIIPRKDTRIKKQGNQSVPTVRGHMLHLTKGVQAFRQHVVNLRNVCLNC